MNLLFVTHCAELSGAEILLTRLLPALNVEKEVLLLQHGPLVEILSQAGIKVTVIPVNSRITRVKQASGLLSAVRAGPSLLRAALQVAFHRKKGSITVAFSQKAFVICAVGQWFSRGPLVWGLNDILSAKRFSPTMRNIAISLSNATADLVLVNSVATRKAFSDCGGREDLACVVYPGVPPRDSAALTKPAEANRHPPFLVGCFGRLTPWKGQAVLIRALAKLPMVHAWIVGAALFGEEAYEKELRQLVYRLGLSERVHFLGHRSDVGELMNACDAIVHTSTSPEPFGQVVVEGMSAGKPVIASASGGVVEIISHGINGILVTPGDEDALASAISRLSNDRGLCREIGQRALERSNDFTIAKMVRSFSEALAQLAHRVPPGKWLELQGGADLRLDQSAKIGVRAPAETTP